MIKKLVKRNKELVPFDSEKITKAIFGAMKEVGELDWERASQLSEHVVASLEKQAKNHTPSVEEVQDLVEKVLIEEGLAKVAKAYILYRQHRAELRKEKQQILQKDEIDEVDKKFDVNALRVLTTRYLKKDGEGNLIESPKQLFTRVAVHTTLSSVFYDPDIFQKKAVKRKKPFVPVALSELAHKKLSIGKYELNEFHREAVVRLFNRLSEQGNMKVTFAQLMQLFQKGHFDQYEKEAESYYTAMVNRQFMPNTPALANFGNFFGMGSACFVLGVEDSIHDIMDKLKAASIIFQSGGGVGYNFSSLRPEGDFVKTTGGVASGPLSFMSLYDKMTDVIKQGGIRRGANMGIMNSNHPDILKFIKAKEGNKGFRNFNISVLIMGDFWKYYEEKKPYPLVNPRNGKVVSHVDPVQLFDLLVHQAWESAEPGVIFYDHANKFNPFLEHLGPIVTTNPCGEVLLYPYESCNLGSINVWAFVSRDKKGNTTFDWDGLERIVKLGTRFLDNVTDVNKYPLPEIEQMSLFTRKIGLGVMGVGDALYELELPYNGKTGLDFMEQLMEFVNYHSKLASIELAKKRGALPAYDKSFYPQGKLPVSGFADKKSWHFDWNEVSKQVKQYGVRNGYTTVVAPTGSISMIAGCSSGIEPVYSLVFEKHITVGNFYYVDPVFESRMQREGLMGDDLIKDVAGHHGSVANLSYIPPKLKKTFVTAHDISPYDHIRALASFQKWVDSSISKTNNFPADATIEDVKEAYELAYKLGCKDVTVYRDGSIQSQVLVSASSDKDKDKKPKANANDGSLQPLKDEKVKGLSVYKEASAHVENDSLGLSPTLMSSDGEKPAVETLEVEPNAPVKCKLCNL